MRPFGATRFVLSQALPVDGGIFPVCSIDLSAQVLRGKRLTKRESPLVSAPLSLAG